MSEVENYNLENITVTTKKGIDDMIDRANTLAILQDIYRLTVEGKMEEAITLLEGPVKINQLVNYYNHTQETLDTEDHEVIDAIIHVLQTIYNNAGDLMSPITDEDYDKLYELNRDLNQKEVVGSVVSGVQNVVVSAHRYPQLRGTLDKIHFISNEEKLPNEKRKSYEDWIKSTTNRLGYKLPSMLIGEMFPKWDGISGVFECDENGDTEKALKRGDTTLNEAEEMTELFKGINMAYVNPFKDVRFGVKTEIVMTRKNFEELCETHEVFKSPRSAVSSIVNSKEFDHRYLKFLTVIPLQVQNLETGEIRIPEVTYLDYPWATFNMGSYSDIRNKIDSLKTRVDTDLGIDIDGVVIRFTTPSIIEDLGRENNINKYEVAYKLPPEQKSTVINDVDFSVGVLGAITPVAKIEPIKMRGNTISSISLGSIDRFESLDIHRGDTVLIKYDVIPYLDIIEGAPHASSEKFVTPKNCPYCGQELIRQPVLRCVNMECDSRVIGKIMNYTTKMNIPNISVGTITALYEAEIVDSIADLYELEDHRMQMLELDRFGPKSVQRIIDGINSRKEVYDYDLIGSLGIPDVGRRIFKRVMELYDLDALIELSQNGELHKLTRINGIKEKTAEKIVLGILMNLNLIQYLRGKLTFKRDTRTYTIKVAFTKVRDKDFEAFLDKQDVLVLDSYTKDVDMLIVPDYQTTSSKVDKAKKANKEVVSIDDAYKLFKYQPAAD